MVLPFLKNNNMAHITLLSILLAFLGLVLQILITVQKVLKSKTTSFSIIVWIKENWFNTIIGVVCTIVSLLMAGDIIRSMGLTAADGTTFYSFHAFLSGYAGREIIFRTMKTFSKPKE